MEKIINEIGKKLGRRITTRCLICKNDSTYNINDVSKLVPMFKLAINLAKKEVFKDLDFLVYNSNVKVSKGITNYYKKLKKRHLSTFQKKRN